MFLALSLALPAQELPASAKVTGPLAPGRILESSSLTTPTTLDPATLTQIRPTRGELQGVSAEVKSQLQRFDTARDSYLKRQKELTDQLRLSSVNERKQVRAQMEELRKQWIEASFQLRKEAQARIPDLRSLSRFEALGAAKALTDDVKRDRRVK